MAIDVGAQAELDPGTRTFSAQVFLGVQAPAVIEYQGSVAHAAGLTVDESFSALLDGKPLSFREITGLHGGRIHQFDAPAGDLQIEYSATVTGIAQPEPVDEFLKSVYLRPSRFAQVDRLFGYAAKEFGDIEGDAERALAVRSFVANRLDYLPGVSTPYDGASETLQASAGVCRDYAHLTVALLRALKLPARMTAVYAPGCDPMDFHAVAEVFVDDRWWALDGTGLAPRASMARIATGRDAADIAFLDNHGGSIRFDSVSVMATTDQQLPVDDPSKLVPIS